MTDRIPTTSHSAGIRALVARHPVTAFLIMVFSMAYPVMSLLALAVHGIIPGGALLWWHHRGAKAASRRLARASDEPVMVERRSRRGALAA